MPSNHRLWRVSFLVAVFTCFALAERPVTQPAPTTRPVACPASCVPISVETYFSPRDTISPIIVKAIDDAEHSLHIAAFTFSHPDIAAAIVRAHERGVSVLFVMDYTQSRLDTCRALELINSGIEVRTRHRRGFQHNKYIVIDSATVITGSYNFAPSADNRNTENMLIIRNAPDVVAEFIADHQTIMKDTLRKVK